MNHNATTIAVAMPATTMAPLGPDRTISSIFSASASVDLGLFGGDVIMLFSL
jgi:hypothetical protein